MTALLCGGHLLVEGAPGLAKTRAIKELASAVNGDFHRIQFTPDLLPSDVTGTDVYRPEDGSFHFQQGPIFHNLVLADEVNRAPAKVQSALLEAMAERQVSIGRETYPLAGFVPRDGDPESDRTGRHVSAARGAARPISDARQSRLPKCRGRTRDSRAWCAPKPSANAMQPHRYASMPTTYSRRAGRSSNNTWRPVSRNI